VGRQWDAVIDTSGYLPRIVRESAQLLAPAIAHYTFVSSISVYASFMASGMDETSAVGTLADPTVEEITGDTYGPLKALCEVEVGNALAGRALIVRPGLIVGPNDPSDRFTYWPWRLAQGGAVLAPGPAERPVQFIDVRDLADWLIRMAETRASGTFNATGPGEPLTFGTFLAAGLAATGNKARLIWLPEPFLLESGVTPWAEIPLWVADANGSYAGFATIDVGNAVAAGLSFRPLAETISATLDWLGEEPQDRVWRAGMKPAREAALLARWRDENADA
jgi:2'-hydroxyisoflavone reductase